MKLFSDAAEYGLRAVVWLSQHPEEPKKVREIAQGTRAAPGYLIKALQDLTKAGILRAQRGSQGGFSLMRDPAQLSMLEVVNAIDPIERINSCPLGLDEHASGLCPMHQRFDDLLAGLELSFAQTSIAQFVDASASSSVRCDGLCGCREGNGCPRR